MKSPDLEELASGVIRAGALIRGKVKPVTHERIRQTAG